MTTRTGALALLLAGSAQVSLACGFHGYAPAVSMVDRLLSSDHIVLARPDPDNPFRYQAIRAIEGGTDMVEIPHLVDSSLRRKLALNPDDAVLFARDEAYGPWQQLAYVDDGMAPLLDEILLRLPVWEMGDDLGRFQMFADALDHPEARIRRLALRELDVADYSILRQLDMAPDPDTLLAGLSVPSELNLLPIRVLLLGLADDPETSAALWPRLHSHARSNSAFLGAFATALVEIEGAQAVAVLGESYLIDAALPLEVRERIVDALALHRMSGATELAPEIDAALAAALANSPDLAPAVARQFGIRNDWSQLVPVQAALRSGTIRTPADLIAVSQYVAFALDTGDAAEVQSQ